MLQYIVAYSHVVEFHVLKSHPLGRILIFKESCMASLRLSSWHKLVRRGSKDSKIFGKCRITNSRLCTNILGNTIWMQFYFLGTNSYTIVQRVFVVCSLQMPAGHTYVDVMWWVDRQLNGDGFRECNQYVERYHSVQRSLKKL